MAAVQPFLSGAISKTVNMPEEATVEDVANVYIEAWRLGLKAIAIYRDGSKRIQPLNTSDGKPKKEPGARSQRAESKPRPETGLPSTVVPPVAHPFRRKLADERRAITHKFAIGAHEGYLTVGLYEEGLPGEIFITMAKEGSTVSGLMDSFATAVSLALQYGVPLKVLCDKFSHARFEPSGWTPNPDIHMAKSVMDYIFRWLAIKFLPGQALATQEANGLATHKPGTGERATVYPDGSIQPSFAGIEHSDDTLCCSDCGAIMPRNGASYQCMNCGSIAGSA